MRKHRDEALQSPVYLSWQHLEPARRVQVETIMISIISMLSSPNDESPANIDAAKEWRENREGFKRHVARIVRKSQEML